jgi:hypothetical protein
MDGSFPDVGAPAANDAREELYRSALYDKLVNLLREAEDVWCKAATREDRLNRRFAGRRSQYSPDELLAEQILELIGTPDEPVPELIEKIAERAAEEERAIAW